MSVDFCGLTGLVQTVHHSSFAYIFRNFVILEVASHVVIAVEVHGEEIAHVDSLEELFGSLGAARAESYVDGEENHIDFRCHFGNIVHDYGECLCCFVHFAVGAFFFPVPVVEVAGMENSVSVGHCYEIADTSVGGVESPYVDAAYRNIIARTHPVGRNIVAHVAAREFIGEYIETFVRLCEIEDIFIVMVFVNM